MPQQRQAACRRRTSLPIQQRLLVALGAVVDRQRDALHGRRLQVADQHRHAEWAQDETLQPALGIVGRLAHDESRLGFFILVDLQEHARRDDRLLACQRPLQRRTPDRFLQHVVADRLDVDAGVGLDIDDRPIAFAGAGRPDREFGQAGGAQLGGERRSLGFGEFARERHCLQRRMGALEIHRRDVVVPLVARDIAARLEQGGGALEDGLVAADARL